MDKVIKQNVYHAHPESILIAMLHDDRLPIRELAVTRISEARAKETYTVRKFETPHELNFIAKDYTDIIYWNKINITEPPVTKQMSPEGLREFIENLESGDEPIFSFPNHTQAVEMCISRVKLVTGTSQKYGENIIGMRVRTGIHALNKLPKSNMLETKDTYM